MARLNGKLDVLGLDPWQPTDEGDGVQLRSGLTLDDATGMRYIPRTRGDAGVPTMLAFREKHGG